MTSIISPSGGGLKLLASENPASQNRAWSPAFDNQGYDRIRIEMQLKIYKSTEGYFSLMQMGFNAISVAGLLTGSTVWAWYNGSTQTDTTPNGIVFPFIYGGDDSTQTVRNSLIFEIEGVVFGQPAPFQVVLRSELDLESGKFSISEEGR